MIVTDSPTRVVRQAFATFEMGDVTDVEAFCHADYRNREAPDYAGPQGFRTIVAVLRGAFSDLSFDEQGIITEGDTVALSTVLRVGTRGNSMASGPPAASLHSGKRTGSGCGTASWLTTRRSATISGYSSS